jgi:hypothetical protein
MQESIVEDLTSDHPCGQVAAPDGVPVRLAAVFRDRGLDMRRGETLAPALFACAVILAALPRFAHAGVCDAAAFSCPATGTCTINGTWNVGSDCVIDFASRGVDLRGTLQAETVGAGFTVRAGSLTLTGGKIRSLGNAVQFGGDIDVQVGGAFSMQGTGPGLETSGNAGGGAIRVSAATINLAAGVIAANGGTGGSCGDAGVIDLDASVGSLVASATVRASTAGHNCVGGSIFLTGASVTVSGEIDARGGAGASDEAVTVVATAGDIVVTGAARVRADGTGQPDSSGASGGVVALDAPAGSLAFGGASVSVTGKSPDGAGGAVLLAASGNVEVIANVVAYGGTYGTGGGLFVDAGGSLSVAGDLVATGGSSFPDGGGGDVALRASGDVLVASTLDVSAAFGGSAVIVSAQTARVDGTIRARGNRGAGGVVEISACAVTANGSLDVGASNGGIAGGLDLIGNAVTVGATANLLALPCSAGCTLITTRSGSVSISSQATVSPAAVLTLNSEIPPC